MRQPAYRFASGIQPENQHIIFVSLAPILPQAAHQGIHPVAGNGTIASSRSHGDAEEMGAQARFNVGGREIGFRSCKGQVQNLKERKRDSLPMGE